MRPALRTLATLFAPAALLVLVLACSGEEGAGRAASQGPHVAWFDGGFDDALQQARATKRLVLIDFWTKWWGYCKRLDRETWSDASVVTELSTMTCLSIDAESKAGAPIAQRFQVRGYPTILVLDASGREVGRIGGFLPPQPFLERIRAIRAPRARWFQIS